MQQVNKQAKLVLNHFDHKVGEVITVLDFRGSGRYMVRFANRETEIIGESKFELVK